MRKYKPKRILKLVIPFIAFVLIFGSALACGGSPTETIVKEPSAEEVSKAEVEEAVEEPVEEEIEVAEEPVEDVISWSEAKYHIGERLTVHGPVISTYYASTSNGQPTFLNIGKDYPDPGRFTVVIWGKNRSNFPQAPEVYYSGKMIYVTGLIEEYEGVAEIAVSSPSQIKE